MELRHAPNIDMGRDSTVFTRSSRCTRLAAKLKGGFLDAFGANRENVCSLGDRISTMWSD